MGEPITNWNRLKLAEDIRFLLIDFMDKIRSGEEVLAVEYGAMILKAVDEYEQKFLISYVDVKPGDTFAEVEDRCLKGWEPFAVSEIPPRIIWSGFIRLTIRRPGGRFWLKRGVEK